MNSRRDSGRHTRFGRRQFLRDLSLAATAGLLGAPRHGQAEPPPETTRLRVQHSGSLCQAPQYVAEDLLRSEGFTDVQYIRARGPALTWFYEALGSGEIDIGSDFAPIEVIH